MDYVVAQSLSRMIASPACPALLKPIAEQVDAAAHLLSRRRAGDEGLGGGPRSNIRAGRRAATRLLLLLTGISQDGGAAWEALSSFSFRLNASRADDALRGMLVQACNRLIRHARTREEALSAAPSALVELWKAPLRAPAALDAPRIANKIIELSMY